MSIKAHVGLLPERMASGYSGGCESNKYIDGESENLSGKNWSCTHPIPHTLPPQFILRWWGATSHGWVRDQKNFGCARGRSRGSRAARAAELGTPVSSPLPLLGAARECSTSARRVQPSSLINLAVPRFPSFRLIYHMLEVD